MVECDCISCRLFGLAGYRKIFSWFFIAFKFNGIVFNCKAAVGIPVDCPVRKKELKVTAGRKIKTRNHFCFPEIVFSLYAVLRHNMQVYAEE